MKLEVVSGVPIPETKGKPRKYPINLDDLGSEDHVLVPIPKNQIGQEVKIIRNFVLRYTHRNPSKKFTIRQLPEGVGIWRIK
tara:strand:+ start:74 stop:319 length:246 start_codon:yes stop_codon:yes gene_type:complete